MGLWNAYSPTAKPSDNADRIGTLPLDTALLAVGAQAGKELAAAMGA